MADGRGLIDKKEYVQAAKRYTDGFSLYRDEFYQAGYGALIESRVDSGLKTLATDMDRFNTLFDRFKTLSRRLPKFPIRCGIPKDFPP